MRIFDKGTEPLLLAPLAGKTRAVGLLNAAGNALILRKDLSQFDFTEAEKQMIWGAVQQG